jgi:signal transduction histidine kinase
MNRNLILLSQRYVSALQKHLKQGSRADLRSARRLGRQAVGLRLETLDIAKIHSAALERLDSASRRDGKIKRAEIFFTETVAPIEKTHGAAVRTRDRVTRLNKTLDRRTIDLEVANRSLKQGIARRRTAEQTLQSSDGGSRKLLEESCRLEKHLRQLTRQVLSTREDRRKKISGKLHDEIAQTLLGINVRLLSLRQKANTNAEGIQKEIASTRRLVDKSLKSIQRFAREFGKTHEP